MNFRKMWKKHLGISYDIFKYIMAGHSKRYHIKKKLNNKRKKK